MKKISVIMITCLILLSITTSAFAAYGCQHQFEPTGQLLKNYAAYTREEHYEIMVLETQCVMCGEYSGVEWEKYTDLHTWYVYNDEHISDAKHIYYQTCSYCLDISSYIQVCGGIHPVIAD